MPEPSVPPVAHDLIVLGKIVGAYGVRGALKIHPFADDPAAWSQLSGWWIGQEKAPPSEWRHVVLARCTLKESGLIACFDQISDRTDAEKLIGQFVGVPREQLPAPRKGEYYWADLIGLEVINMQEQSLGRVLGLIETAAHDVLRIGSTDATGKMQERLVPFVGLFVPEVNLNAGYIRVDWNLDW